MESNEMNMLVDVLAEKICNRLFSDEKLNGLFSLADQQGRSLFADEIANKVFDKFQESGALDVANMDIEQLQSVVSQLQASQEPDIVVKRME